MRLKIAPFDAPIAVSFEASVSPSERREKVVVALQKLATADATLVEQSEGRVVLTSQKYTVLGRIYEQIRARQTLGVARRLLTQNASLDSTWVYLHRQAAYVGVAALCEDAHESPLGPIRLTIQTPQVRRFIDWLAPG